MYILANCSICSSIVCAYVVYGLVSLNIYCTTASTLKNVTEWQTVVFAALLTSFHNDMLCTTNSSTTLKVLDNKI